MMARPILVGAFCFGLVSAAFGQSSTFTAPTTRKKGPKVKVTCNGGTSFTVDYGQTTNLCCTVVPKSRASKISASGSPDGVFSASTTTAAGCDVGIQVQSSSKVCLAQSNVQAILNGKPIATFPGAVNLPNIETMMNENNPLRSCAILGRTATPFDYMDQWLATFMMGTTNLNLKGVPFSETLTTVSNSCSGSLGKKDPPGLVEGPFGDTLPGGDAPNPNQWVDLIGFCGDILASGELPPANCFVKKLQAVSVGACPIQTNIQTITFSPAGAVSTNRTHQ